MLPDSVNWTPSVPFFDVRISFPESYISLSLKIESINHFVKFLDDDGNFLMTKPETYIITMYHYSVW